ncbi:MAG: chemotaxis protein CheW [Pseudomonadota bacterium]
MTDKTDTPGGTEDLELLSFKVGEQEYSVDIMLVREIRGWTRATPLPHSEDYVRGVINLRGAVLPIVDLACRLGLGTTETAERNVIIVVQIHDQSIGLLVGAVSDILSVSQNELQPPPDLVNNVENSFVKALTIVDGRMLRVIDLNAVYPNRDGVAA